MSCAACTTAAITRSAIWPSCSRCPARRCTAPSAGRRPPHIAPKEPRHLSLKVTSAGAERDVRQSGFVDYRAGSRLSPPVVDGAQLCPLQERRDGGAGESTQCLHEEIMQPAMAPRREHLGRFQQACEPNYDKN